MSQDNTIPFNNGFISVKDGESIDLAKLRASTVYAKLFVTKGTKISDKLTKKTFLTTEKGEHIKASLFIIGSRGQIVEVDKVWAFVDPKTSKILKNSSMYYCELHHPTLEVGQVVTLP